MFGHVLFQLIPYNRGQCCTIMFFQVVFATLQEFGANFFWSIGQIIRTLTKDAWPKNRATHVITVRHGVYDNAYRLSSRNNNCGKGWKLSYSFLTVNVNSTRLVLSDNVHCWSMMHLAVLWVDSHHSSTRQPVLLVIKQVAIMITAVDPSSKNSFLLSPLEITMVSLLINLITWHELNYKISFA